MLRTSPIQVAENLPLSIDEGEDADGGSKTSSTTRSAKNSLLDIAENAEVGVNGDGSDDEIVKRSPPSKMSSGSIEASDLPTL